MGNNIKNSINSLNSSISNNSTKISNHTSQISTLNSTVSNHTSKISTLISTVSNHTSQISTLNSTVNNHTSQISTLNSTVNNHSAQIDTLNSNKTEIKVTYIDTTTDEYGVCDFSTDKKVISAYLSSYIAIPYVADDGQKWKFKILSVETMQAAANSSIQLWFRYYD